MPAGLATLPDFFFQNQNLMMLFAFVGVLVFDFHQYCQSTAEAQHWFCVQPNTSFKRLLTTHFLEFKFFISKF